MCGMDRVTQRVMSGIVVLGLVLWGRLPLANAEIEIDFDAPELAAGIAEIDNPELRDIAIDVLEGAQQDPEGLGAALERDVELVHELVARQIQVASLPGHDSPVGEDPPSVEELQRLADSGEISEKELGEMLSDRDRYLRAMETGDRETLAELDEKYRDFDEHDFPDDFDPSTMDPEEMERMAREMGIEMDPADMERMAREMGFEYEGHDFDRHSTELAALEREYAEVRVGLDDTFFDTFFIGEIPTEESLHVHEDDTRHDHTSGVHIHEDSTPHVHDPADSDT